MGVQVARIGNMCITHGEDTLKAILGSCVGIALIWKQEKICTLSHCLLAESPEHKDELNAKYVSDAIPMMLEAMNNVGRQRFQLEAVVIGGGVMLSQHGNEGSRKIGPNNLLAVRKYLKLHNVTLATIEDAGGNASQIIVDGTNCSYELKIIPKAQLGQTG